MALSVKKDCWDAENPESQTLIYQTPLCGHRIPAVCTVYFHCVLIASSLHFWLWSFSFRLVYDPYQILEFWPPIKQVSLPRLFASVIAPLYLCISKECVGGIFFWQPALYGHLDNWIIQTVCQVPMSVLTTLVGTFSTDGFQDGYGNRKWSQTLFRARECHPRFLAAVAAFPSTANRVVWRTGDYGSFRWVFY